MMVVIILHLLKIVYDELEMLFNENIDNFKNIGTYYSQKDI